MDDLLAVLGRMLVAGGAFVGAILVVAFVAGRRRRNPNIERKW